MTIEPEFDEWDCVDTIAEDPARILRRVGVPTLPPLARYHPREEVLSLRRPEARDLAREDLGQSLVSRVRGIYRDDETLYRSVLSARGRNGA